MVTPSMPEQSCKEIIPLLDAYFDQELSTTEKADVERHLSGCSECSTKLANIESLVGSLKSMPKVEMKRDITDMPLPARGKVVAFKPRVWAAVGVAAAAVALLAVATYNSGSMKPVVADKPSKPQTESTFTHENETQIAPQAVANQNQSPKQAAQHTQVAVQTTHETTTHGTAHNGSVKPPTQMANNQDSQRQLIQSNTVNQAVQQQVQVATQSPANGADRRDMVEVAVIEEGGLGDALGIATDEDGLYELKM